MINPYIFREYDIRGKVAEDFPEHVVIKLGKAFGTFIKRAGGTEIAVSGDIRLTTPELIIQFKSGALSTGVDVINLGILPTPVNYYSMFHLGVFGAVQITGSHNPPEFNGFKMSLNKKPVFGDDIQTLYALINNNDFDEGEGTEARYKILNEYNNMIKEKITIEKPMKVVMDCGNAAAAINAPEVFKSLGIELKELFCEPDGTFPNHHPDPTVEENLKDLINEMRTGEYDVGLAFDGDADRVGVVDEKGDILWADQLMSIFLPEIIENEETILFDVKCSQALEDMINRHNGKPFMWKTGHSLIKQKMVELDCKFGGEMSGHIFFADDYYGYDDALYVAARLVQLLSRAERTLSELKAEIPVYYSTPEMRMEAENDEMKFMISNKAVEYFSQNYDCITVDGVRIKFGDGWGLVRASNTQPVIVCRFEANTPERRDEIMNIVLKKLSEFGELRLGGH
ncbi:MAG: phosphomannomutase/phosphoglucomutase [bacterium TMED46]|nr:MAG: phosphomannomutase/phosphoglucomutase [bacterium TMED46]|tara:strand:+ start:1529 stop:2893 length:1365 start_codon:yes stop_codon:yes gene_type:complete